MRCSTPHLPITAERSSDQQLMRAIQRGDQQAFEQLILRHRGELRAHCQRVVGDNTADDALQQTLINAFNALSRPQPLPDNPRAWLHRVARNASLDMLRRGREQDQLEDTLCSPFLTEQTVEDRMQVNAALEAIQGLPERQRQALLWQSLEGQSYSEIAERLSTSEPVVKQLLNRARSTMRAVAAGALPWLSPRDVWQRLQSLLYSPAAEGASQMALVGKASATVAAAGVLAVSGGQYVQDKRDSEPRAQAPAFAQPLAPAKASAPASSAKAKLAPSPAKASFGTIQAHASSSAQADKERQQPRQPSLATEDPLAGVDTSSQPSADQAEPGKLATVVDEPSPQLPSAQPDVPSGSKPLERAEQEVKAERVQVRQEVKAERVQVRQEVKAERVQVRQEAKASTDPKAPSASSASDKLDKPASGSEQERKLKTVAGDSALLGQ